MKQMRWETDRRYYAVRVYQDLFDAWVVERAWGGKRNQLGNRAQEIALTYPDAEVIIQRLQKERAARKYQLVFTQ